MRHLRTRRAGSCCLKTAGQSCWNEAFDRVGAHVLVRELRCKCYVEVYFAATLDCTIAWNSFNPSAEPSKPSLERSGCGIIPRTLRPSLQMPAMLSSEPFGFAAAVTSPAAVE